MRISGRHCCFESIRACKHANDQRFSQKNTSTRIGKDDARADQKQNTFFFGLKFSNIFSSVFIFSILCTFFSFQLIFLSLYLQRKNNQKLIGIVECEVF